MQIPSTQIVEKDVVGMRKSNNTPVMFVRSIGGLNVFFVNDNGQIKAAGAAPHKAIGQWMAEKLYPDIVWDRSKL